MHVPLLCSRQNQDNNCSFIRRVQVAVVVVVVSYYKAPHQQNFNIMRWFLCKTIAFYLKKLFSHSYMFFSNFNGCRLSILMIDLVNKIYL